LCARSGSGSECADACAIRIELGTALRANGAQARDAGRTPEVSGTEPVGFEPGPRSKREFAPKSLDGFRVGRVIDSVALPEITTNAKTFQQRHQPTHRFVTQLPNPLAGAGTVEILERRQLEVGLLQ
jgi:hypothetical protein